MMMISEEFIFTFFLLLMQLRLKIQNEERKNKIIK